MGATSGCGRGYGEYELQVPVVTWRVVVLTWRDRWHTCGLEGGSEEVDEIDGLISNLNLGEGYEVVKWCGKEVLR